MPLASASIKSIVELRGNLEKLAQARNASYKEVVTFYGGSDLQTAKKQGFLSGVTNAITSIFSPQAEDEDLELITPINLVKPAIENKVAFLSLPPTIRVIEPPDSMAPMKAATPAPEMPGVPPTEPPMPGMEESLPNSPAGVPAAPGEVPEEDWASVFADRLEKVILTLLDASNMPKRCRDVAWSVSAMDGAVIGVWPDLRLGRPRIFTRTPLEFYPIAYDADGLDLKLAVWVDKMTGDEILAQYDVKDYLGEDEVEVIFYIDETKFCTVLNGEKWAHTPVDNLMGLVPIVCVGSLGLPGMIFGSTDIKDAIPVAKQINYHMALIDKMANAMVEPTIFIKDPLNVPPDLAIGKGGVATAGPNGGVELLGPIDLPNAFWQLGAQLNNWFDLIADNPAQLRGQDGGSIITGKGFNAQLGPVAARMQVKLDLIMAAWKRAIKYMLLMWANFPGANEKLSSSGQVNGEYYYIEATPDEFKLNGKIWVELDVFLSAQAYIDKQGNAIELIQLYQNELLDWNSVADSLPQISDKARVRRGIEKDRQWKAEGMAAANAAAQSPMTANPELGAQERVNYGLERGFMGEVPPMAGPEANGGMAGAPPEMGGPAPGPESMQMLPEGEEDVVDILEEFFAGIGKLKGEVWFGGDPLTAPEKFASDNWTVTVWVTDPQDKGTITQAAAKVPEVYGHIKFEQGRPGPGEDARQVSGGSEEEPPEKPEDTGNPDLNALIGGNV